MEPSHLCASYCVRTRNVPPIFVCHKDGGRTVEVKTTVFDAFTCNLMFVQFAYQYIDCFGSCSGQKNRYCCAHPAPLLIDSEKSIPKSKRDGDNQRDHVRHATMSKNNVAGSKCSSIRRCFRKPRCSSSYCVSNNMSMRTNIMNTNIIWPEDRQLLNTCCFRLQLSKRLKKTTKNASSGTDYFFTDHSPAEKIRESICASHTYIYVSITAVLHAPMHFPRRVPSLVRVGANARAHLESWQCSLVISNDLNLKPPCWVC